MVSRNQKKMEEKLAEISREVKEINPKMKTMAVVADFSKMYSIKEYEQVIGERLKDLDIGVLIANAGVGSKGPFKDNENDEIE